MADEKQHGDRKESSGQRNKMTDLEAAPFLRPRHGRKYQTLAGRQFAASPPVEMVLLRRRDGAPRHARDFSTIEAR
jgi:hypothetical protein